VETNRVERENAASVNWGPDCSYGYGRYSPANTPVEKGRKQIIIEPSLRDARVGQLQEKHLRC